MPQFQFSNNPQTTLSGAITASATSLSVLSGTSFPTRGQFTVIVDSEIMLVTGVAGTVWTVQRGYDDTVAAAHNNNAAVTGILTRRSFLLADRYDVRAYGAVGDGVADDTAALQAAINDAGANGGGRVYLHPGSFKITSGLTVSAADVHIVGEGDGSKIVNTNVAAPSITISGARCGVKSLALVCDTTTAAVSHAIKVIAGGNDCEISDLRITGSHRAIWAEGSTVRGRITGCTFTEQLHDGIHLAGVTRWQVSDNYLYALCTLYPVGSVIGAIVLSGSHHNVISNNRILTTQGGIDNREAAGIFVYESDNNVINGNHAEDCSGQGIVVTGETNGRFNAVTGNVCIDNGQEGITCFRPGAQYNTITGNVCRSSYFNNIEIFDTFGPNLVANNICDGSRNSAGIYVGSASPGSPDTRVIGNIVTGNRSVGIQVQESSRVTVADNLCWGNNQGGFTNGYEGSGIVFNGASTGGVITGNVSYGPAQRYGISMNNTSNAHSANNQLAGNVVGPVENIQLLTGRADGHIEFNEVPDPSAGGSNSGRLFVRDNGAGKSQLAVKFASGAVQIIATEP